MTSTSSDAARAAPRRRGRRSAIALRATSTANLASRPLRPGRRASRRTREPRDGPRGGDRARASSAARGHRVPITPRTPACARGAERGIDASSRVRSAVRNRPATRGDPRETDPSARARARGRGFDVRARRRARDAAAYWPAPGNGRRRWVRTPRGPRDDDFVWASDRSRKPSRRSTRPRGPARARASCWRRPVRRRGPGAVVHPARRGEPLRSTRRARARSRRPVRAAGSHAAPARLGIVAARALVGAPTRPHRAASAAWTRAGVQGFARVDDPRASPADRASAPRARSPVADPTPGTRAAVAATARSRRLAGQERRRAGSSRRRLRGKGPGRPGSARRHGRRRRSARSSSSSPTSDARLERRRGRRSGARRGGTRRQRAGARGDGGHPRVWTHQRRAHAACPPMADGVTEHRDERSELHVHGPPRVQSSHGQSDGRGEVARVVAFLTRWILRSERVEGCARADLGSRRGPT